jgi:hypothetical protein
MAPEGGSRNGKRKVRELWNRHQANPTVQDRPASANACTIDTSFAPEDNCPLQLVGPLVIPNPGLSRFSEARFFHATKSLLDRRQLHSGRA